MEESLKILKELYKQNPSVWAESYATSSQNLANSYLKSNQFEKSFQHFEEYFKIYDFSLQENITWFLYPYVKWYQAGMHLNDDKLLQNISSHQQQIEKIYQEILGDTYEATVSEIVELYNDLGKSDDPFDREKYDIVQKLFRRI